MSPFTPRLLAVLGLVTLTALAAPAQVTPGPDKAQRLDIQGDPLPDGALARIGAVRLRHGGEVGVLGFAADGKSLFSLGGDQTFRRWDVATGKELSRLEKKGLTLYMTPQIAGRMPGMRFPIPGIVGGGKMVMDFYPGDGAFYPVSHTADGKLLAILDVRNAILLLDTTTGKQIRKIELKEMQGHALALSPDGKLLAVTETTGEDNFVRLWDLQNGKELPQLKLGRQRMVTRLLFSHDSKLLAGISGAQIRMWDVTTGKRTRLYEGHENVITSVAFSHDGKFLATAGGDGSVRVWETASEEEVKKYTVMDMAFTAVAFTPDGKYLFAASADRNLHLWNLATDQEKILQGHNAPAITLAVSADSQLAASADSTGQIRIWDVASAKERETVKQQDRLHGLGVYDGGRSLAMWTVTGKVRHLDTLSGIERDTVKMPADDDLGVAVAPDGRVAVVWNREEDGFRLWDGIKGQELHKLAGHPGGVVFTAFAPDSKRVATAGSDSTVRVWNVVTGKEVQQLTNLNASGMAFSPDGKLLAVLTDEAEMCLFETATNRERCRLKVGNAGAVSMRFSPDSRLLAVITGDEVIRVWDVVQGKLLRGLVGHQGPVNALAFAPRGELLASGGVDGTVRLWKVQNGEEQRSFEGHQGSVDYLAFADDGKTVISFGSDNCVLVWDTTSRALARSPGDPAAKKMGQHWADLASEDGMISFKAMGEMIGTPSETVDFLGKKLHPVPVVDPAAIQKLVEDLDNKNFGFRQKASKDLEKLAGAARSTLEKALTNPSSAEMQTRIKKLIERLDAPVTAPEELRTIRAVEVLERIATPEAKELLGRLAKGAPGARLTKEASESLMRLTK